MTEIAKMSEPETQNRLPPYLEDLNCREALVDSFQAFVDGHGQVRLECCVLRSDPNNVVEMNRRVPVARLVLTPQFAEALAEHLMRTVAGWRQRKQSEPQVL
jgi:hypothetical protein